MELIYSVKDIFSKYLNGNEKFVIPAYQRGYKWNTKDIKQLLCDINAFQTHGDSDVFCCLQNGVNLYSGLSHLYTNYEVLFPTINGKENEVLLKRILLHYKGGDNETFWKRTSPYYDRNYETSLWKRIIRDETFLKFY